MSDNPQKIPLSLPSPASENLRRLADLFPSIIKDGEVDFTALKEELGIFEETGKEQYELTWAGKQQAKRLAAEPVVGRTLKYIPEESKNADTTENLYIEGDNLEVLKLLQNSYMGKIKMIYIDPPYNTGSDFVYRDNFAVSARESDQAEGRIGEDGERLAVNPKTSARYHANWLSMMYPRLQLAKNLLSDDGMIFISIDDNEVGNLREICDEIFGAENVELYIWDVREKGTLPKTAKKTVRKEHEYICAVYKDKSRIQLRKYTSLKYLGNETFTNPDNDPRGNWMSGNISRGTEDVSAGKNYYCIETPTGIKYSRNWAISKDEFDKLIEDNRIYFSDGGNGVPRLKIFANEPVKSIQSSIFQDLYSSEYGAGELAELFQVKNMFSHPKPSTLVKRIITICTENDEIILDFFSGSATTADAVMQLNADDGGNRKFIMVQYPEELDDTEKRAKENKEAIDFCDVLGVPRNICEIGKERIRRAGEKIKADHPEADIDTGFKVLRTADTNIRWIAAETGQTTLEDVLLGSGKDLRDFMPGTKDLDVVYEILLRQYDIPLTANIEQRSEIGPRTYSIADTIIVCLEETVTEDIISKLAAAEPVPHKIILRDSAFADDISLKENAMMRLDALMQKHSTGGRLPYTVEFL